MVAVSGKHLDPLKVLLPPPHVQASRSCVIDLGVRMRICIYVRVLARKKIKGGCWF